MIMNNTMLHYKTYNAFKKDLDKGLIKDQSVTYIKDKRIIYTHGAEYNGGTGSSSEGISITSTSIDYAVSEDGQNAPATGWSKEIPSISITHRYIWTRTIVNYSDNTNTTAYSVAYSGKDGNNASALTIKGRAGNHFKTADDLKASNPPQITGTVIYLIDEPSAHITVVKDGNVMAGTDEQVNDGDAYLISTANDSGETTDVTWVATANGWVSYNGSIGLGSGVDVITDKDLSDMGIK